MGEELLTLKQVAERLDLPESTLRKYRDAYVKHIPCVGSGRERKYREETVEVFKLIRDCRAELHLSWEDTEKELAKKFATVAEASGPDPAAFDERVAEMFEKLGEAIGRLEKSGARQEFLTTSLAGELMNMGSSMGVIKTMAGDMRSINKTFYDYHASAQRQQKQTEQNVRMLLEAMGTLLEGMSGIESAAAGVGEVVNQQQESWSRALLKEMKELKDEMREGRAAATEKSAQSSDSDRETILKLKEELFEAKVELGKYKALYERAREEQEKMKSAKATAIAGSFAEPVGMRPEKEPGFAGGGKLFVRGKKK